ncbi:MAG: uracil-DNA glycosylase [Dictyoglomaceae bacterium]
MDGKNNMDLKSLEEEVKKCRKCSLWEKRKNVVFGEGDTSSKLMFIGEAPGYHEDQQGRPFVGAAGKLLTELIESLDLKRENVYIANVLKCRPPNNRDPNPEEIQACYPWLEKQIEIINPRIICTLGRYSAYVLLKTSINMSSYHGKSFEIDNRIIFVTYHPAAALYHGKILEEIRKDFSNLKKIILEMKEENTKTEQLSFW